MPKAKSNRENARSSTGPKTPQGKRRSARNRLRHGLSLSALSDPTFCEEVDSLAQNIVAVKANPQLYELARRVAEAQIDLRRVRYARHELISNALADREWESGASLKAKYQLLVPLVHGTDLLTPIPDNMIRILDAIPIGPLKLASILSDMAQKLSALDRYERRALSRRKFAIRAFDAALDMATVPRANDTRSNMDQ
jgi:hypothetical protein